MPGYERERTRGGEAGGLRELLLLRRLLPIQTMVLFYVHVLGLRVRHFARVVHNAATAGLTRAVALPATHKRVA